MSDLRVDGTLDIECASWDRFAVGVTHRRRLGETRVHRSISDLVDCLLASGGHWWSHFGGLYDLLAIAEEMRRRSIPCRVDLSQSRVSRIVSGNLTLRDSYPLIPLPLTVAAGIAGETLDGDTGLRCKCGFQCGGFCSIRPGDGRKSVVDKCERDARVLYDILVAIRDFAATLDLTLRGTIGATAWATAQASLNLPDAEWTPVEYRAIRDGYYGGRVIIVRPHASGPGTHWDINAAYPFALASTRLPIGQLRHIGNREATSAFDRGRAGIYTARVTVADDTFVPPLPVRLATERIGFPVGAFDGTWTGLELSAAVERGVRIETIDRAVVWPMSEAVFEPLIQRWYSARRRVGKYTALGQWLRILSNSLPGKFAERPERRSVSMFPREIKYCLARRPCTINHCTGRCGAYEQIDRWGEIWGVPYYRIAPCSHVHWAAYLLASNRVRWLSGAESQGGDLVYGDTDSLWSIRPMQMGPTPRGGQLGEWALKHGWSNWQCVGPRAYRFISDDGQSVIRTAGMSVSDDDWHNGRVTSERGVLTFMQAARASRGLFKRTVRKWALPTMGEETGIYGDRVLDRIGGVTYPLSYERLLRRE